MDCLKQIPLGPCPVCCRLQIAVEHFLGLIDRHRLLAHCVKLNEHLILWKSVDTEFIVDLARQATIKAVYDGGPSALVCTLLALSVQHLLYAYLAESVPAANQYARHVSLWIVTLFAVSTKHVFF